MRRAVNIVIGRERRPAQAIPVRVTHYLTRDDLHTLMCLYASKESYNEDEVEALTIGVAEAEQFVRSQLLFNPDAANWWSDNATGDGHSDAIREWATAVVDRVWGKSFRGGMT